LHSRRATKTAVPWALLAGSSSRRRSSLLHEVEEGHQNIIGMPVGVANTSELLVAVIPPSLLLLRARPLKSLDLLD
jgi:hypothetical protein